MQKKRYYVLINLLQYILMGAMLYFFEKSEFNGWKAITLVVLCIYAELCIAGLMYELYLKEKKLGGFLMAEIILRTCNIVLVGSILNHWESFGFSLVIVLMSICSAVNLLLDIELFRRFEKNSIIVQGQLKEKSQDSAPREHHYIRYYLYAVTCFNTFEQGKNVPILSDCLIQLVILGFVYSKLKERYLVWRRIKKPIIICVLMYVAAVVMHLLNIPEEVRYLVCVICIMVMVRVIDELEELKEKRCL